MQLILHETLLPEPKLETVFLFLTIWVLVNSAPQLTRDRGQNFSRVVSLLSARYQCFHSILLQANPSGNT